MAQGEPPHLAGLPQQRHSALHTGRRQDSLPGFRHRKDTDERVQGGVQEIMDMFVLLYNLHHLPMEMVQIFAIAHIVYKLPL